ncbi:MAG: hypothetical protein HY289_15075 [Planctomycetes bacterium]|nr:hypothetical protein [Planctomycetota bacterium]
MRESLGDMESVAGYFEYYAGIADKLQGDTIPLGPDWHRVWTTGYTFFMDQPLFFYNRIAERDYRVQMIWSREFDARKCRLPVLPKDSDRNAHFQEVED